MPATEHPATNFFQEHAKIQAIPQHNLRDKTNVANALNVEILNWMELAEMRWSGVKIFGRIGILNKANKNGL